MKRHAQTACQRTGPGALRARPGSCQAKRDDKETDSWGNQTRAAAAGLGLAVAAPPDAGAGTDPEADVEADPGAEVAELDKASGSDPEAPTRATPGRFAMATNCSASLGPGKGALSAATISEVRRERMTASWSPCSCVKSRIRRWVLPPARMPDKAPM